MQVNQIVEAFAFRFKFGVQRSLLVDSFHSSRHKQGRDRFPSAAHRLNFETATTIQGNIRLTCSLVFHTACSQDVERCYVVGERCVHGSTLCQQVADSLVLVTVEHECSSVKLELEFGSRCDCESCDDANRLRVPMEDVEGQAIRLELR